MDGHSCSVEYPWLPTDWGQDLEVRGGRTRSWYGESTKVDDGYLMADLTYLNLVFFHCFEKNDGRSWKE